MNKILVILLFLTIVSCQKEKDDDPYEKYYGDYICLQTTVHWGLPDPVDGSTTYLTYDTVVVHVEQYRPVEKKIIILDIEINIDDDGSFINYSTEPQNPYGCGTTYGHFYGDSIKINQPDMYCESSVNYKGKKINP